MLVYCNNKEMKIYGGQPLMQGQVFETQNLRNDARLVEIGYLVKMEKDAEVATCISCQLDFVTPYWRDNHARVAHREQVAHALRTPNPDSETEWELEPDGAPDPEPMEVTGSGQADPVRTAAAAAGGGRKAREVVRL